MGDKSEYGNSRGISLLSVTGKIMAKILLKRLIKHILEDLMPETQCGFRLNRFTSDMIFKARQTMEKCWEQQKSLFWEVLGRSGCLEKFIKLVRLLHDGIGARFKVGNLESEPFQVSRGVKQGCTFAPVLFNLYVSYITRGARLRNQHKLPYGPKPV